MAVAPAGGSFVVACGSPYRFDRVRLATFGVTASARRPPGAGVRRGVAFSRDGATVYPVAYDGSRFVLHTLPGERTATGS